MSLLTSKCSWSLSVSSIPTGYFILLLLRQSYLRLINNYICILLDLSVQARGDTRSIFKRRLASFNLEFSFSLAANNTKVKEPSFHCCLHIARRRISFQRYKRYMKLHSNGDIIIIIIIKVLGLGWFYVGYVGITLVALILRWLRWYYVGCYPLAKCWWKIKVVEKNEDVVRFCMKV